MINLFGKNKKTDLKDCIVAPVNGKLIPLEQVKDEVFAQKMIGDGAAVVPDDELIVAPCTGKITMLYPTLHAFGIQKDDGIELLVHIGIDTVRLNGKGFKSYVKEGDFVEAGDKIIRFDSYEMNNLKMDMTVMTLFSGHEQLSLNVKKHGYVKRGKSIVVNYKKKEDV